MMTSQKARSPPTSPKGTKAQTMNRSLTVDMLPNFKYKGADYLLEPPSCSSSCNQCICCWKDWITFKAAGDKSLKFKNPCSCCSPWGVYEDGQAVGSLNRATICDQSWKYIICTYCCGCFNCTCNNVVKLKIKDKKSKLRATFLERDNACVRSCGGCLEWLSTVSACCCDGCAYYCRGQNTVTVLEKIFNGNRDDPVQIGELKVVSVRVNVPNNELQICLLCLALCSSALPSCMYGTRPFSPKIF